MSFFGFGKKEETVTAPTLIDKVRFSNIMVQVEEVGRTVLPNEALAYHDLNQHVTSLANNFFQYQKARDQLTEIAKRKTSMFNAQSQLSQAQAQYASESAQLSEYIVKLKSLMRVSLRAIQKEMDNFESVSPEKGKHLRNILQELFIRLGTEINLEQKVITNAIPKGGWW